MTQTNREETAPAAGAPGPQSPAQARPPQARGLGRTAALCVGLVAAMVGLTYASVPFYELFCRVTGYDGTPVVGTGPAGRVVDRIVTVRFDANVAPGLTWQFTPEQPDVKVKVGETTTVYYKVRNVGTAPATGIATFNVQPGIVGGYFVKLQCFCFTEQTLQPGETVESAVVFYVDPDMTKDMNTQDLSSITLSYTYFPAKAAKPVTAASAGSSGL